MNSPSWMCYGRGLVKTQEANPRQRLGRGLARVREPWYIMGFIRDLRVTPTGQQTLS